MKVLAILFTFCLIAHAATPTMWVKDRKGKIPLRIDTIDAQISITGDLAETTLTLRFRNETNRMQEGEFVMPLPQGSTVSSYALEVNGKLRDGVAVEKKQARHAYETIKRQKIDPGLIEREANNTYRTKVFPIPARGTKLVRLSYIEHLPLVDGKLHYALPVDYPGEIGKFTCTIRHQKNLPIAVESPDLSFTTSEAGKYQAVCENQRLTGEITINTAPNTESIMLTEPSANNPEITYFYLNYAPPAEAVEKPRLQPRHINIIWDASDSRRSQNHQKEIQLLDAYFKQLDPRQPIRVTLQILRNSLQDAGEYSLHQSDWSTLRTTLEKTFYDGSTAFEGIKKPQHLADLTLLFTDASHKENADLIQVNTQQNTFIFHQGDELWFRRLTNPHFGASINLMRTSTTGALRRLTHTRFRVDRIMSANATLLPATSKRTDRLSMVGFFKNTLAGTIEISFKNGNGDTLTQQITPAQVTPSLSGKMIQRLWSQENLLKLERQGASKTSIIQHCQKFGLVSDYTSLIVLERFRDYVRFNIPPPEAELRKKWQVERAKMQSRKTPNNWLATQTRRSWQHKLDWHHRTFTWQSKAMLNHAAQAHIWLRAMNTAFDKKDLDPSPYGIIKNWYQETQKLAKNEAAITTGTDFTRWIDQQSKLTDQWQTFAELPIKPPSGQPLAVSIRGLVATPDTYYSQTPLTLKQSIKLAGGLHAAGSLQYISLYRNASALTYNLLSKKYQDIQLLPGDMVVADSGRYDDYSGCSFGSDPFSSGGGGKLLNASSAPAVAAQSPQVTQAGKQFDDSDDDGPFGGSGKHPSKTISKLRIIEKSPERMDQQAMEKFDHQLKQKNNPLISYQTLKGNHPQTANFYIYAARILQKHRHTKLAIQVISNISEHQPNTLATHRESAYLLGDLGLWDNALSIFRSMLNEQPTDIQTRLDIARYTGKINTATSLSEAYQQILNFAKNEKSKVDAGLVSLTLTERNAYLNPTEKSRQHRSENLQTDIRCVIYSSHPKARIYPKMHEPMGAILSLWGNSTQGGKFFKSQGIAEYMLKRAMPGKYTLKCSSNIPVTLQIAFYSHWGTDKQTCQWTTLHLDDPDSPTTIAEWTMKFED